jgi:hypothetical protein
MHASRTSAATIADVVRGVSARALDRAASRAGDVAPGLEIATDLLSGPPALARNGQAS